MSLEELKEIQNLLGEVSVELLIMRARVGKTSRLVEAETSAGGSGLERAAVLQTLRECGVNLTAEIGNLQELVQRLVIASQRLEPSPQE